MEDPNLLFSKRLKREENQLSSFMNFSDFKSVHNGSQHKHLLIADSVS